MLQERFDAVICAHDRESLLSAVLDFAQRLGFDRVCAMAGEDDARGELQPACVDNTPAAHRESFESRDNGRCDPVMQHCKVASVPIAWNQATYTCAGLGSKWEQQAPYGFRTGIAVALHLPERRHVMLGVDRHEPLPSAAEEVARIAADLQLFAAFAVDSALRVLLSKGDREDMPVLTARELDSLRWTMEGKTAWEVGRILGISEQTAVRHLSNASRKLCCVNKHQAVVKALRLRLIA